MRPATLLPTAVLCACLSAAPASADEALSAAAFDQRNGDGLRFGPAGDGDAPLPGTLSFEPGSPQRPGMFAGVLKFRGDALARLPVSVPSVEGVVLEDVVWFRFGADGFGLLAGDQGGHTLVRYNKGGPQIRVRGHPALSDGRAEIEYFDGTRWQGTAVHVRPEVPYRLRTVMNLDLKARSADVFLWDMTATAEKPIVKQGRCSPLVPEGLERWFEAAGRPKGNLELAGWQLWELGRRLERIRTDEGLVLQALNGRFEPKVEGDAALIRGQGRGYEWAALPTRRGFSDEFPPEAAPADPAKGPAAGWTGTGGRLLGDVAGAEGGCLEASGLLGLDNILRRKVELPRSDWTLALRFRVPAGLEGGRVIRLVEFHRRRGGQVDRVGPLVTLRVPPPSGGPLKATLTAVTAEDLDKNPDRPFHNHTFELSPDAWYVLTLTARPSAGKYQLRFATASPDKTITTFADRVLSFVAPEDLTVDPQVELALSADLLYEYPVIPAEPPGLARADAAIKAAGAKPGQELRGAAIADGKPVLLLADDRTPAQAVVLDPGGTVPERKVPLPIAGPVRGMCWDPWQKCWWVVTPERPVRGDGDPRRRFLVRLPPITRLDADFGLSVWPPGSDRPTRPGREPRQDFPLDSQTVAGVAAGPEELYVLTTGGSLRAYDKVTGVYRRVLALRGHGDRDTNIVGIAYGAGMLYLTLRPGGRLGEGVLVVDPRADGFLGRLRAERPVGTPLPAADDRTVYVFDSGGRAVRHRPPSDGQFKFSAPFLLADRVEIRAVEVPPESDGKLLPRTPTAVPLVDWRTRVESGRDLGYIGGDPGQYRRLKLELAVPDGAGLLLVEVSTLRRPEPDPVKFFVGCLPDLPETAAPVRVRSEEFFRRAAAVKWSDSHRLAVPNGTMGVLIPASRPKTKPTARTVEIDLISDLKLSEGDAVRQIRLRRQNEDWAGFRVALAADDRGLRQDFAGAVAGPVLELSAALEGEDDAKAGELRLVRAEWDTGGETRGQIKVEVRQGLTRYDLADPANPWKVITKPGPVDGGATGRFFQWRISLSGNDPYVPVRLGRLKFGFAPADPAAVAQAGGPGASATGTAETAAATDAGPGLWTRVLRWAGLGLLLAAGGGVLWWTVFRRSKDPSAA
jgi:hypothetical protein